MIFQVVVFARSAFPEPDATDLVQKVFTESDANKSVHLALLVKSCDFLYNNNESKLLVNIYIAKQIDIQE